MHRLTIASLVWILTSQLLWAQRDPPMTECYLPSISIHHADGKRLSIDLVLKKETGSNKHREHQMYLLAYLLEDEEEVLKIASDPALLDKRAGEDANLFLDVLLDRNLVVEIGTEVAKRQGFAGQDLSGSYADGSKAGRGRAQFLKLNTFSFSFEPTYLEFFESVSSLKHFKDEETQKNPIGVFEQKFKLLVFVPVNDCKYASKTQAGIRGEYDFAVGEYGNSKTPSLYCRPLPYEFVFRRDKNVGTIIYIR